MTGPRILAFDTSGPYITAAVLAGGANIANTEEQMARGQAERLMSLLEEVLATADLGWRDLDALGVGIGPGNFTGIRISVAAARGLALGLGIPAVGVDLFDAQALGHPAPCVTSVAAPRGDVYAKIIGPGDAAPVQGLAAELPLDLTASAAPTCLGPGADVLAARFGGAVADPAYPLAEAIARIATTRMDQTDLPRPAPLYVRPADAAPSRDLPPKILT